MDFVALGIAQSNTHTHIYINLSYDLCGVQKFNHATCHTQGQGGQYNSKESIHSGGKAGEAGHGHVNGTLPKGVTL